MNSPATFCVTAVDTTSVVGIFPGVLVAWDRLGVVEAAWLAEGERVAAVVGTVVTTVDALNQIKSIMFKNSMSMINAHAHNAHAIE